MHASAELPVWHCIELFEVNTLSVANIAQIREAAVDEA